MPSSQAIDLKGHHVYNSYRVLPDGLALLGAVTDAPNPVALMTSARVVLARATR